MMTRREKLLVRPWQLRRYNNHKKKVINATPMIDFGPPPERNHVSVKLKKLQKERERQMKIEEDNFKLLTHLRSIMRKKRIDDYWETQPPTFLRRVSIYPRTRTPTPTEEISSVTTPKITTLRKSKCVACTPHFVEPVPELQERIPWEPPKKILTRRQCDSAVVPVVSDFDIPQLKNLPHKVKLEVRPPNSAIKNLSEKSSNGKALLHCDKKLGLPSISLSKKLGNVKGTEKKIVVRQGQLQIVVNFPSFSEVKLVQGNTEKYLQKNVCECKSYQKKYLKK